MVRFYSTRSATLRLSFVALVVGRLSCAVAADADTTAARPLRVEVSAPKSCPKTPALLDRVKTHTALVREALSGEAAELLRLDIVTAREGFVAQLRLSGDDGLDRRVSGKTCEEVLAAVALIVALNVDATAGQTPDEPPAEATADASIDAPVVATRRRRRRADAGTSPPETPLQLRPSLGSSVQARGFSHLVVANSIWAEGSLNTRWSPSLRLRFTRTRSFTEGPEGWPAFFRTTTGSLEGCATVWRYDRPTLELRPCLALSGGTIEGASGAIGPREEKTRPWVTIGSLAQLRWRFFGPLVLEAGLGFDVALFRDDFYFRPGIPVYRAPAVLFVGDVGIGTTFR